MFETVKTEGNKEYYYNADHKLVYRYADDTIGYRVDEIDGKVQIEIDIARGAYRYPTKTLIDAAIEMQRQSTKQAARYVNYKLLGEYNYNDVFGIDLKAERIKANWRDERIDNLVEEISDLKSLIKVILQKMENNA